MKKKYLILFAFAVVALTLLLSGCGGTQDNLEGKYIATFELNGGKLNIGTTEVSTKINYAYDPDSYILDPSTYGNYQISRPGYIFTGWYKTAECKDTDKWDFKTQKITDEKLTLFAGWEREIVYTFTVCYVDGGEVKVLGSYNASEGSVFEDYRKYADLRDGFTPFGYYSDAELTTPWNFDDKHPGGEVDTDIKVYVDFLEGEWIIVNNYSELKAAAGKGNIYLNADIDCEGKELAFKGDFKYTFEGNGHTVSNFTVNSTDSIAYPSVAIFNNLADGAVVKNVNFKDVVFNFTVKAEEKLREAKVAALAVTAGNCTVTDVTVSGKLVTTYGGELTTLNEAVYAKNDNTVITNFTSNVVIEKQS